MACNMKDDLTPDVIRQEREYWKDQAKRGEHTWVPPQNAKRLADICDRALKEEKTEFSPDARAAFNPSGVCKTCGTKTPTYKGYCCQHR